VPGINPQLLNACEDTGGALGADDTNNDAKVAKDQTGRSTPAIDSKSGQGFTTGYSCCDIYSANAVTAVLCRDHPNCMADFVKMFEDHYSLFDSLSEVRCSWFKAAVQQQRKEIPGASCPWCCTGFVHCRPTTTCPHASP
jgi:hypothetical protein